MCRWLVPQQRHRSLSCPQAGCRCAAKTSRVSCWRVVCIDFHSPPLLLGLDQRRAALLNSWLSTNLARPALHSSEELAVASTPGVVSSLQGLRTWPTWRAWLTPSCTPSSRSMRTPVSSYKPLGELGTEGISQTAGAKGHKVWCRSRTAPITSLCFFFLIGFARSATWAHLHKATERGHINFGQMRGLELDGRPRQPGQYDTAWPALRPTCVFLHR